MVLIIKREISCRGQEELLKGLRVVPDYKKTFPRWYPWFKRELLSGPLDELAADGDIQTRNGEIVKHSILFELD